MKKNILTLSTLILTVGTITFTSCKKDDVTAPVVTLNGDAAITIPLQGTFTDLGATANDTKDGVITPTKGGDVVDVNTTGVYVISYSATDAAGNTGKAERTVTVINSADAAWAGSYNVIEVDAVGSYTYAGNTDPNKVVKITSSSVVNNQVWINRLGDFLNNKVKMDVVGNTSNIPSQTVLGVGSGTATCNVHDRLTSSGIGSNKTSTGFTLTYSDSKVAPCTGTRPSVVAAFVKK